MTAPTRPPQQTIRQLREEREWSQLDLALRLGVSVSVVSWWERGVAQPTLSNRLGLAMIFGVSVTRIALQETDQA